MLDLQKNFATKKLHKISLNGKPSNVFRKIAKNMALDFDYDEKYLEESILSRLNSLEFFFKKREFVTCRKIEMSDLKGEFAKHAKFRYSSAKVFEITDKQGKSAFVFLSDEDACGSYFFRMVPNISFFPLREDYTVGTKMIEDLVSEKLKETQNSESLSQIAFYSFNARWLASWVNRSQSMSSLWNLIVESLKQLDGFVLQNNMYYDYAHSSEVARAFEPKKNVNESTQKAMTESPLNVFFKEVEFDNDVDLKKVKKFEQEAMLFLHMYGKNDNKPTLRLRKLGKHSSANRIVKGLYYPANNNLIVDYRNGRVDSFVHEYGHYLDHTLSDEDLSLSSEFADILTEYRSRLKTSNDYYRIPTEVFARAYQFWISEKNINADINDFDPTRKEFEPFVEMKEKVNAYFDKIA